MSEKIKKPQNPKMKALENKIFQLEQTIEELKVAKSFQVDLSTLPKHAVALRFDSAKSLYFIDVVRYDDVTGVAKLQESLPAGDSQARARFELQKYLAQGGL